MPRPEGLSAVGHERESEQHVFLSHAEVWREAGVSCFSEIPWNAGWGGGEWRSEMLLPRRTGPAPGLGDRRTGVRLQLGTVKSQTRH